MKLKIEKIELYHFLSYENAEFSDLNNYNVFIGKNNSGKSNLFKVFRMLKENYQKGIFSPRYLYEANTRVEASITIFFKLPLSLRRELLSILYHGNYLHYGFLASEGLEGCLKKKEWQNKNLAIPWLLDQGYYSKVKLEISYYNVLKNICISQVSAKHKKIEEEQILLRTIVENTSNNTIISDLSKLNIEGNTIRKFFTEFPSSIIGSIHSSLTNFFNDSYIFSKHPILSKLMDLIKNEFFDTIFLIPEKRKFKKD
ncbi:MAG TPA: hypothetical protein ENH75_08260, partial [archaeon]|nr:hypothetical protein [archaeon]